MADLAFLMCVERGRLEGETLLLVESLRRWGGRWADAPVYAFAPRPANQPEPATIERLETMGAAVVTKPLVSRFEEFPTFNKVGVCAWAERELDHDTLVFTDSDCVFTGEPTELGEGDWIAAARPVDRRIAGSKGKGKNEPFWKKMYAELGVKRRSRPFVETTVGAMPIRAYWNSGLIAAKRSAGLYTAWEAALNRLFDAEIVQKRWPQFMDQLSWAGVTADVHDKVHQLSPAYNYPLPHRGGITPEARELDLSELVHIHYRLWFHMGDALDKVVPAFNPGSEHYRWLAERLPVEPEIDDPDRSW